MCLIHDIYGTYNSHQVRSANAIGLNTIFCTVLPCRKSSYYSLASKKFCNFVHGKILSKARKTDCLTGNHYQIIHRPVRGECSFCRVCLWIKKLTAKLYRSGMVNSNTVNSKSFHLIRSFFEIFATFLLFRV